MSSTLGIESFGAARAAALTPDAQAGGQELPHRLVGQVVEVDQGIRRLHVQVDVPTTGYMQSRLRRAGATVILSVSR